MKSVLTGALLIILAVANVQGDSFEEIRTDPMASRARHSAATLHDGRILLIGGTGSPATAETFDRARGFAFTGSLSVGRYGHTATTLRDGRVLVAGGNTSSSAYTNSAEIYDPATGTFSGTGAMSTARSGHTATLLADGRVLIAGGIVSTAAGASTWTATAEIYDPATGNFTATGSMASVRGNHAATLLPNGRVLVSGGRYGNTYSDILNTAETYDPGTGLFTAASTLGAPREGHTSTLLLNGLVLIVAGQTVFGSNSTAELFNPATGTFSATDSMSSGRVDHVATLLTTGKVLITGSNIDPMGFVYSTQIYDPATALFSDGPELVVPRYAHTATLLPGGEVLLVGSGGGDGGNLSAELYRGDGPSFTATDSMSVARESHTSTLLADGKVLVTGGANSGGNLATAEVYDPATGQFANVGSMTTPRKGHTATLLRDGRVLVTGGYALTSELYDPATGTFSATGPLTGSSARRYHTATLLADGRVLVTGGATNLAPVTRAEIYDPVTGQFTQTDSMSMGRSKHSAVLLKDGRVLVVGNGSSASNVAELYDPATGLFTTTDAMQYARQESTATLMPDGRVHVTGGYYSAVDGIGPTEIYDPATETFGFGREPQYPREGGHVATLLADGRLLIVGDNSYGATAEVLEPTLGFRLLPNMPNERRAHRATLLRSGRVLITGGLSNETATNISLLFDPGDGFAEGRRPVISTIPSLVCQPATMSVTGTNFFGGTTASDGGTQDTPANLPMLRLQRVDNDHVAYARPSTRVTTAFVSTAISGLPYGHYRASIWSNGIPSLERIVEISTSAPTTLGTYLNRIVIQGQSSTNIPSDAPVYGDAATVTVSASAGFQGTLSFNRSTGAVDIGAARPAGTYTITVTASTSCTSVQRTFSLVVQPLGAPTGLVATASSASSVAIQWNAVNGAVSYQLWRKAPGTDWTMIAQQMGTSTSDPGRAENTAYLYRVRGVDASGGFGSYSVPELATTSSLSLLAVGFTLQQQHILELRTATQAVRTLAGQGSFAFTDASLTGVVAKAVHVQQLYTVLASARTALGLPSLGAVAPNAGALIRASDLTTLQDGVR